MKRAAITVLLIYALSACAVPGSVRQYGPTEAQVASDKCLVESRQSPDRPQAAYYDCMQRNGIDPNGTIPQQSTAQENMATAAVGGFMGGVAAVLIGALILSAGDGYHHHHHYHFRH